MIGDLVHGKFVANRLLTDVEDCMLEQYHLPDGHIDIGLFTTACDGVGYVAADDATKKSNVQVAQIYTTYGGCGKFNDGQVFGVLSGPMVSDVERGLRYVREFTEKASTCYSISDDDSTLIYAQCVSRIGSYFAKAYKLKQGSSIAYLIAPAMHGAVGIDEALTQANVDVVRFWSRPTESNMSGAILTGRQAQCETAVSAFKEAIFDLVSEPIEY
ncbi:BMC domain-containing protein [Pseudoramibacter sp. HA2172]|uniref:BMC domain-containing protein n=1 Tax=Pseudoramibacter faecis TaxID=3108534 RepID=UPI002E774BA4|nr:BMC domain-containing protein [Pseudoramibacter sp. HA2172]